MKMTVVLQGGMVVEGKPSEIVAVMRERDFQPSLTVREFRLHVRSRVFKFYGRKIRTLTNYRFLTDLAVLREIKILREEM